MRSPRGSVFGKSWTVIANMLDARVFESNDILIQFPPLIISLCGVGAKFFSVLGGKYHSWWEVSLVVGSIISRDSPL